MHISGVAENSPGIDYVELPKHLVLNHSCPQRSPALAGREARQDITCRIYRRLIDVYGYNLGRSKPQGCQRVQSRSTPDIKKSLAFERITEEPP